MDAFLQDPATWTGIGLVIFLLAVIFIAKAPKTIAKGLDDRAAQIRSELDRAASLRQTEAETPAKDIAETPRREAEKFAKDASAALAERIKLREKLAEERIARAETEAMRDVRIAAVDTASKAAAAILTEQLTGKAADDHFAASLEKVTKALS